MSIEKKITDSPVIIGKFFLTKKKKNFAKVVTKIECPFVWTFQMQKVLFETKYIIYAFGKSNKIGFLKNAPF